MLRVLLRGLIVVVINFPIPFISIELAQKPPLSTFLLVSELIGILFVNLTLVHLRYLHKLWYREQHWLQIFSVAMLIAMLFIITVLFANTGQDFQPKWMFYSTFTLIVLGTICLTCQIVFLLYEIAYQGEGTGFFKVIVSPIIMLSLLASVISPCILATNLPRDISIWMWISAAMYSVSFIFALAFSWKLYRSYKSLLPKKVKIVFSITYLPCMVFWIFRAVALEGNVNANNPERLYVIFVIIMGSWTLMPLILSLLNTVMITLGFKDVFKMFTSCWRRLWSLQTVAHSYNDIDSDYGDDMFIDDIFLPSHYQIGILPPDDSMMDSFDIGENYMPPFVNEQSKKSIIKMQLPELKETQCLICWENFAEGEDLLGINGCGHTFHAECLKAWTARNPKCPICKVAVKLNIVNEN